MWYIKIVKEYYASYSYRKETQNIKQNPEKSDNLWKIPWPFVFDQQELRQEHESETETMKF